MLSRTVTAVLVAGTALTALCQSQPSQLTPLAQVPDYMLYDAFFFRVNWLNNLADKLDTQGQNGAWVRSEIARKAKLTSQQQQTLNAVAADYRDTNNAILASIVSASAKSASAGNAQQIQNLQNQRKQNVLNHVAQLQTTLGNPGFQQFAAYVRAATVVRGFAQPAAQAQ